MSTRASEWEAAEEDLKHYGPRRRELATENGVGESAAFDRKGRYDLTDHCHLILVNLGSLGLVCGAR